MTKLLNYTEKNELFSRKVQEVKNLLALNKETVTKADNILKTLSILANVSDQNGYVFPKEAPLYNDKVSEQINILNQQVGEYNKAAQKIKSMPILLYVPLSNGAFSITELPTLFNSLY